MRCCTRQWLVALGLFAASTSLAQAVSAIEPEVVQSLPISNLTGESAIDSRYPFVQLSPVGQMLAVNDGQRFWLYRRDSQHPFAITPRVAPATPFDGNAVVSLEDLKWAADGTLYAWVLLYNGSTQAYAADRNGPRGPVLQTPTQWPRDNGPLAERYAIPEPDFASEIRANASHIVWLQNRGHGDLVLMSSTAQGKPHELARGSWELEGAAFDAQDSRVMYATDRGVVVHALTGGAATLVAGTRDGDRPQSYDPASRWLAMLRPKGGCDPATANTTGKHICLLRLPAAMATPSRPAATAQPSFDCEAARSVAEHLLCEQSPLARLDVTLAGLYRQAMDRVANPGALRKFQLDWLSERDRNCIANKTLTQARDDLSVTECLRKHYVAQIASLRGKVAPALGPMGFQIVKAETLQPTAFGQPGCTAAQALFATDAAALALEMDCLEAGKGRRFWLLDLQKGRAVAASPVFGPVNPQTRTVSATGADLVWAGDLLIILSSAPDPAGKPDAWVPIQSLASLGPLPKNRHMAMPESLLQRRRDAAAARETARALDDDGLLLDSALRLGRHLVWLSDQGRGNIILRSKLDGIAATRDLQQGSWELRTLLHDDRQLIYPSDEGLMMVDLDSGMARRVRDTAEGDLPLAWNPATRTLAWTSPRMCRMPGGTTAFGLQLCIAVLEAARP